MFLVIFFFAYLKAVTVLCCRLNTGECLAPLCFCSPLVINGLISVAGNIFTLFV